MIDKIKLILAFVVVGILAMIALITLVIFGFCWS